MEKVLPTLPDANRIHQGSFRIFNVISSKLWLTEDNKCLLCDCVHVIKCIRNNRLTDKIGQLQFTNNNEFYVARWNNVKELNELESENLITLSRLNTVSVNPKPIERQSLAICLLVFCDETVAALKNNSKINQEQVKQTILFLEKVSQFWRILNVKVPRCRCQTQR